MTDLISKDKVLRCLKESSEQIDWGQSEDGDAFKHYVGASYRTIAEFKPEQPQWISVKDDLPKEHDSIFANHTHLSKHMWAKESDNVIVYVRFPDGTGRSTEGRLQDGKWWTRVSPMLEPVVTHWMPLPEPPKELS